MPYIIFVLLTAGCLLFQMPATAQITNTKWKASWISLPQSGTYSNLWTCYRKTFKVSKKPKVAVVQVATDTKYWLYVNGKMAIFEGGLKRGPTPTGTYYDIIDLSSYVTEGTNTFAVLVWYFGKDGFSHKSSGNPGLIMQSDSLGLITDSTWKVQIHPAYYSTSAPNPNFRLPEHNVAYDATKDPGVWYEPKYDDSKWPMAKKMGLPPTAPWGNLEQRPIPMWKDYGLKTYPELEKNPKMASKRKNDTLVLNLPYNAQITPYLKVNAKEAGLKIHVFSDNYYVAGNKEFASVRAEYITKKGEQEYESFGWFNGHQVIYVIPKGVEVLELKYRETGYNTEFKGSFKCNDPFFNTLFEKSVRTLYVNMRDTYFDCPDRERAQWWGDVVLEMGESFYAFDPKAALLARKGLYELFNWSKSNNVIYAPVPSGNWDQELPHQMLSVISPFGLRTYFYNTNDYDTYKAFYTKIYHYLKLWNVDSLGRVEHRVGGWDWGDWGTNIDFELLDQTWYYLAAKEAKFISGNAAMPGDFAVYDRKLNAIKSRFDSNYWDAKLKAYRSPKVTIPDDRSNAMAVLAGLVDTSKYKYVKEVLLQSKFASPYMEKYVLEALFKMGYYKEALVRMKSRYAPMVETNKYTTLWEGWELNKDNTYNHGWSGGPLTLLMQYIVGFTPFEPTGMVYAMSPRMDLFSSMDVKIPISKGDVAFDYIKTSSETRLNLTWPAKTLLNFFIPKSEIGSKTLYINSNAVIINGYINVQQPTLPYNRGVMRNLPPSYRISDLKDRYVIYFSEGVYSMSIK